MRAFRTLMYAAIVLATTACANTAIKDQAASPTVEMPPASATVAVSQPNVPPAPETTIEAGDAAEAQKPNQTEVGIVGVFDPASDFGQMLATWGWSDSRYLVLPQLGPRKVRDALSIEGDQSQSPIALATHSMTTCSCATRGFSAATARFSSICKATVTESDLWSYDICDASWP